MHARLTMEIREYPGITMRVAQSPPPAHLVYWQCVSLCSDGETITVGGRILLTPL